MLRPPPPPTLFPYTTLFRSACGFSGRAEYDTIREVKRSTRLPVVANGDITTPEEAKYVLEYTRSEEHTSELQSLRHLVCRLLLEKKKKRKSGDSTAESTQIA